MDTSFYLELCSCLLILVMLNKFRCHAHFKFSANQITWFRLIRILILNDRQYRSRSVCFFRICKGRVNPGSAGQGLITYSLRKQVTVFMYKCVCVLQVLEMLFNNDNLTIFFSLMGHPNHDRPGLTARIMTIFTTRSQSSKDEQLQLYHPHRRKKVGHIF